MQNTEIIPAWQEAYCIRTCPPDKIFFSDDMKVNEHMRTCPFCRERVRDSGQGWDQLRDKILDYFPLPEEPDRPAPGQVWTVSEELSDWQEEKFYNPPQVLILKEEKNILQVVQLYGDTALFGPDDILLGEFGFAETWNTFALAAEDLGVYHGEIEQEKLARTIDRIEKKDFSDINENSTLYQFRLLELEVGSFFSSRSINALLVPSPSRRIAELLPAPESLKIQLGQKYPQGRIKDESDSLLMLATFEPPAEKTAMAASSSEGTILVNKVKAGLHGISITGEQAWLTACRRAEETVFVSGSINSPIPEHHDFLAWWSTHSGNRIPADEVDLDPQSGEFDIQIGNVSIADYQNGSPVLLLIENEDS